MDLNGKSRLRAFMDDLLRERDDTAGFADTESLFASGRLESLAAVQLVAFLEEQFALDFSNLDFEIDRIDSIDLIATLCDEVRG
jgi:acyl carrier protein